MHQITEGGDAKLILLRSGYIARNDSIVSCEKQQNNTMHVPINELYYERRVILGRKE